MDGKIGRMEGGKGEKSKTGRGMESWVLLEFYRAYATEHLKGLARRGILPRPQQRPAFSA